MRTILLWMFCCLPVMAEVPHEIRLASEPWEAHTEADGTGLAWDLLRAVFGPEGIGLSIESVPYTRSIGLTRRGVVHGWVGAYRDEVPGMHYPRWHYDADSVHAVGLRSAPEPSPETLGQYRLAWIRGYAYDQVFPARRFREIDRRSGVLGMLSLGHIDYFIDDLDDLQEVFDIPDAEPDRYRVTFLSRVPLYIGFGSSPEALALAELFDRRMDVLVSEGALRPLFERWGQPYPFEK